MIVTIFSSALSRPLLRCVGTVSQVEQEHLTSRNILLEKLRAVRETQAAETQAQSSGSGEIAVAAQGSDASTNTEVRTVLLAQANAGRDSE